MPLGYVRLAFSGLSVFGLFCQKSGLVRPSNDCASDKIGFETANKMKTEQQPNYSKFKVFSSMIYVLNQK